MNFFYFNFFFIFTRSFGFSDFNVCCFLFCVFRFRFPWHFFFSRAYRYSVDFVFTVFRASPCVDHIRFRFGIPRDDIPQTSRRFRFFFRVLAYLYIFCCIVAVVVMVAHFFFFGILAYACGVVSVDRAYYLYVGCIIFYVGIIFPSFGWQYFAGVNWQVAKRTKVLSASM